MHTLFAIIGIATNLLSLSDSTRNINTPIAYRLDATVWHTIDIPHINMLELSLHDSTGAFSLRLRRSPDSQSITPGDILTLASERETIIRPIFVHSGPVEAKGRNVPPEPIPASADDILTGRHDHQFIKTCGLLRNVLVSELNAQWICLVLTSNGQNLYAATPQSKANIDDLSTLLHRDVELVGIVIPQDGSLRHRVGRVLHFNGIADIRTKADSAKDPFDAPELSTIGNLPPTEVFKLPRHRLSGRVSAVWDRKSALLLDADNVPCRVEFSSADLPACGTIIDALGYPESDLHYLNLSDAVWRPSHTNRECFPPDDKPIPFNPNECRLNGNLSGIFPYGRLVKLTGTVLALPTPIIFEQMMFIRSHTQIIPVNIGSANGAFDKLSIGTEIEVTGVCVMNIENYRPSLLFPRVNGTTIILRTPDDIRILARPPWWTPSRLTGLIGGLLAVLLGILVWNIALSRTATRKSRALLKEQLGHVKAELKTEERTRLAVELHDSLAQSLTGVSLELDTADRLADENITATRTHMQNAARSLKSCRDELRNCLWDLRNRALEERTMNAAIRQTLAPHVGGIDLAIRFDVPRERISDNTAHTILRIIRELTLNGIRHGNATKIRIAGSIDGNCMSFSVRDNGSGFDPATAPGFSEGHYGLMGIQERIDEFEGEFKINSAPHRGTKATITLFAPQESTE